MAQSIRKLKRVPILSYNNLLIPEDLTPEFINQTQEPFDKHDDEMCFLRSLQVDESTNITGNEFCLTFIRFIDNEEVLVSSYFTKTIKILSQGKIFTL